MDYYSSGYNVKTDMKKLRICMKPHLHQTILFIQGDELMVELMKLQTIAEQGLALELLQQLVNSVMSSYTLAR